MPRESIYGTRQRAGLPELTDGWHGIERRLPQLTIVGDERIDAVTEAARERRWPPNCCVPAFLGAAVASLTDSLDLLKEERVRRALAVATGVSVSTKDYNPWNLPVSEDVDGLGVRVHSIVGSLRGVQAALGCQRDFSLEVTALNKIPFQLYEDAVLEMSQAGAVVALSFDYGQFVESARTPLNTATRHARHVVRLTPNSKHERKYPTIESAAFKIDYSGGIHVFDDSDEMGTSGVSVSWLRLVSASRAADGGFWCVHEVS